MKNDWITVISRTTLLKPFKIIHIYPIQAIRLKDKNITDALKMVFWRI
jgi:hypothetical protein